jgi:hypothetical protein
MVRVGKISGKDALNLDKIYGVDASTIGKVHGVDFSSDIILPSGIILPMRGAGSVPTNWSIYNSADGKQIVGAGSTYSVDDNGAGNGNINLSHVANDSHLGTQTLYGSIASNAGSTTYPNHSHTTMTFSSPAPNYTQHRLIKADSDQTSLPQDVCLMKHETGGWSGLTRQAPAAVRYFRANTADGTGGNESASVTSSFNGAHNHGTLYGTLPPGDAGTAYQATTTYGSHQHSFTATLTFNLNYVYLNMWYKASGSYTLDGADFIGMYENVTPPTGWSLCDGTGGTPDMRDHFYRVHSSDSTGTGGAGNVTCTTVTNSAGTHRHWEGNCNSCPRGFGYHVAYTANHTHTCNHNATWLPPYYALAFIMYTG